MSRLPGRHRKHTRSAAVSRALTVSGAGALFGAAQAVTATTPAHADIWSQIRGCESGGDYAINTGNGYYGAYQFSLGTWRSLGYGGLPSSASPAVQDAAARQLAARSGFGQWPVCGRGGGSAGSVQSSGYSYSSSRSSGYTPATTSGYTGSTYRPHAAPRWPGHDLTTAMVNQQRGEVRAWQEQMARRGWHILVDGYYGPQSSSIARQFQAEKGIRERPGVVGQQTWKAAWELPVT